MPKIILIILGLQYTRGLVLKTTTAHTFGIIDLIIHIVFAIQTIGVVFLVYMYINGYSKENSKDNIKTLVNSIVNLIILLFVIIFSLNLLNVYLIDTLSNIF